MLGVCFEGVGQVRVRDIADPVIESPSDAIVKVSVAGLCGSDLHPFLGREKGLDHGTVMGHEFIGEVIAIGADVEQTTVGTRVCSPFTTNCGHCYYCNAGLTSRCVNGQLFGWRENGEGLHGGQSTLVRVPHADGTLMEIPDGVSDEAALLLGDNLSTGRFAADMAGVSEAGTFGVIGCGTVGLLAITAAKQLGAKQIIAVDPCRSRLELAESLGAVTYASGEQARTESKSHTNQRGLDGVMELVGLPEAQRLSYDLVRPGGTLSVIGCHCTPNFSFSPTDAYDKNLTYRTGRCPARHYMDLLTRTTKIRDMDLSWCVTHHFPVTDAVEAYRIFSNREDGCIKAVLHFD
ncbi:MAG: alcohol dehydrogenase catalytic domain-containing protein [Rubripirellula sp.]|nr:alcohol dehydrogenase catalytic domain-containing protein [Rubripirellula sp.]